jgi:hypothetical protein
VIKATTQLPSFKVGDIIDIEDRQYVITGILSIFNPAEDDYEPTLTYKILTEKLVNDQDN